MMDKELYRLYKEYYESVQLFIDLDDNANESNGYNDFLLKKTLHVINDIKYDIDKMLKNKKDGKK